MRHCSRRSSQLRPLYCARAIGDPFPNNWQLVESRRFCIASTGADGRIVWNYGSSVCKLIPCVPFFFGKKKYRFTDKQNSEEKLGGLFTCFYHELISMKWSACMSVDPWCVFGCICLFVCLFVCIQLDSRGKVDQIGACEPDTWTHEQIKKKSLTRKKKEETPSS